MGNKQDNAGIRIPPPIFFFVCLGLGLTLDYFLPIDILVIPIIINVTLSGLFIAISGYFAVSAFIVLIKNKTTFDTSESTTKIVTNGSFRFSRNPLYFSLLILLLGIAVLFSSLWLFLMVPVLYIIFLFKAVKPEEKYLSKKFGKEYVEYSRKVRRWI